MLSAFRTDRRPAQDGLAAHRPGIPVISLDELRTEFAIDPDDAQAPVIRAAREQARDHL